MAARISTMRIRSRLFKNLLQQIVFDQNKFHRPQAVFDRTTSLLWKLRNNRYGEQKQLKSKAILAVKFPLSQQKLTRLQNQKNNN
jgi:hypothetical protein